MRNFWLDRLFIRQLKCTSIDHDLRRLEDVVFHAMLDAMLNELFDKISNGITLTPADQKAITKSPCVKQAIVDVIALEFEEHIEYYSFVGIDQQWLVDHFITFYHL